MMFERGCGADGTRIVLDIGREYESDCLCRWNACLVVEYWSWAFARYGHGALDGNRRL